MASPPRAAGLGGVTVSSEGRGRPHTGCPPQPRSGCFAAATVRPPPRPPTSLFKWLGGFSLPTGPLQTLSVLLSRPLLFIFVECIGMTELTKSVCLGGTILYSTCVRCGVSPTASPVLSHRRLSPPPLLPAPFPWATTTLLPVSGRFVPDPSPSLPCPRPLPAGTCRSVLLVCGSASVLSISLLCSWGSTYEWDHRVLVFL